MPDKVRIALDAMGGDHGAPVILPGADISLTRHPDIEFVLFGNSAAVHTVKAGETLTRIAHQHGTSIKAIRAANNLKTDRLFVGQKLKLPAGQASSASSETPKTTAVSSRLSNPAASVGATVH